MKKTKKHHSFEHASKFENMLNQWFPNFSRREPLHYLLRPGLGWLKITFLIMKWRYHLISFNCIKSSSLFTTNYITKTVNSPSTIIDSVVEGAMETVSSLKRLKRLVSVSSISPGRDLREDNHMGQYQIAGLFQSEVVTCM